MNTDYFTIAFVTTDGGTVQANVAPEASPQSRRVGTFAGAYWLWTTEPIGTFATSRRTP
jgi:hypothetical protein